MNAGREMDKLIAEKVMGIELGWARIQSYNLTHVADTHWYPSSDYWGGKPIWSKEKHPDLGVEAYHPTEKTIRGWPKALDYQIDGVPKPDIHNEPHGFILPPSVLHYSTDISAAWQVVEKLTKKRLLLRSSTLSISQIKVWIAHFLPPDIVEEYQILETECSGESAPEAICKAALLAVEYEEGDPK